MDACPRAPVHAFRCLFQLVPDTGEFVSPVQHATICVMQSRRPRQLTAAAPAAAQLQQPGPTQEQQQQQQQDDVTSPTSCNGNEMAVLPSGEPAAAHARDDDAADVAPQPISEVSRSALLCALPHIQASRVVDMPRPVQSRWQSLLHLRMGGVAGCRRDWHFSGWPRRISARKHGSKGRACQWRSGGHSRGCSRQQG